MPPRHPATPTIPACYATTFPGLEAVAAEEISSEIAGEIKRTAPGLIVFRPQHIDRTLLSLRTVEDVFLLLWGTDQLTYRAEDLAQIERWTAQEADWVRALQYHHAIRPKPKSKPTYRLVAQMRGEHGYRRVDALKALARGVSGKLPASWRSVEEDAAVEIWLSIQGATAVCGLRLSDKTMRHRTYKHEHVPASLRPVVAAAMVRLAEVKQGHVLLDPMCGAGTILGERLAEETTSHLVGGDIDWSALRAARANLRSSGNVMLVRWNARRLPVRALSIDRIVCNPPFGKQLAATENLHDLYKQLVAEADRVLKPGGRAVILVGDRHLVDEAMQDRPWRRYRALRLRILGQPAFLTVWQKSSAETT